MILSVLTWRVFIRTILSLLNCHRTGSELNGVIGTWLPLGSLYALIYFWTQFINTLTPDHVCRKCDNKDVRIRWSSPLHCHRFLIEMSEFVLASFLLLSIIINLVSWYLQFKHVVTESSGSAVSFFSIAVEIADIGSGPPHFLQMVLFFYMPTPGIPNQKSQADADMQPI